MPLSLNICKNSSAILTLFCNLLWPFSIPYTSWPSINWYLSCFNKGLHRECLMNTLISYIVRNLIISLWQSLRSIFHYNCMCILPHWSQKDGHNSDSALQSMKMPIFPQVHQQWLPVGILWNAPLWGVPKGHWVRESSHVQQSSPWPTSHQRTVEGKNPLVLSPPWRTAICFGLANEWRAVLF